MSKQFLRTLKRPDAFLATMGAGIEKAARALSKNPKKLWGGVGALLVLVFVTLFVLNHQSEQEVAAKDAAYFGQASVEAVWKRLLEEKKKTLPAPAVDQKKNKKGEQAKTTNPTDVELMGEIRRSRLDVETTYADALKTLRDVLDRYPRTSAAFDSAMRVGGLFLDHGVPARAVEFFKRAYEDARKKPQRLTAAYAQGFASEDAGQYREAIQAYQLALDLGDSALKGDLLMAKARCHELLGEKEDARSTYEKIISELPESPFAQSARLAKARVSQTTAAR